MVAARRILPTDLLALVTHSGAGYANQAWPRDRLGAADSPTTLAVLRDQLAAFGRGRSAWVSLRRQRLQGLVGARRRGGRQAWEIDYLMGGEADPRVLTDLLNCALRSAGRHGAEKLFLRLDAESPLLPHVREAGFTAYREEILYALETPLAAADLKLRASVPADSYPLYRLYNATTAEAVRRFEAASYTEWQASLERHWLKHGRHLIYEEDGELLADVRAARLPQGLLLDLTLHERASARAIDLVSAARKAMAVESAATLVLVSAGEQGLARRLEDAGFRRRKQFVSLVHRTARPMTLPKVKPVVAKNAVGV